MCVILYIVLYITSLYFNIISDNYLHISNNFRIFAKSKTTKYKLNNIVMDLGFDNSQVDNNNVQLDENGNPVTPQDKTDLGDGKTQVDENGNPITKINEPDDNGDNHDDDDKNKNDNPIELKAGEIVAIGDDNYTVAENGDLLDKDGKVFKESKDVQEYLKSLEQADNDDDKNNDKSVLNIKNIQEALGYQIVDENDKDIEYENNIEGVKTYVNDVIEQKTNEIQEATLNTLFEKYPFVQHIINYYVANGNSLDGWGVEVDRSGITIDDNNEKQQEEIIRTAWKEQKRTGDVDSYINYLKSAGTLLSVAKSELEGLQQADATRKQELAQRAKEAHDAEEAQMTKFWKEVEATINKKEIGGYKIPDQIKVTREGKSLMLTPKDFYNYLSVVDKNGETAYSKDCKAVDAEKQFNDSLLRAYIMFTGGDYSSLVDMAIKDKEVKILRFKAQASKQPTYRFTPKGKNDQQGNVDLGY